MDHLPLLSLGRAWWAPWWRWGKSGRNTSSATTKKAQWARNEFSQDNARSPYSYFRTKYWKWRRPTLSRAATWKYWWSSCRFTSSALIAWHWIWRCWGSPLYWTPRTLPHRWPTYSFGADILSEGCCQWKWAHLLARTERTRWSYSNTHEGAPFRSGSFSRRVLGLKFYPSSFWRMGLFSFSGWSIRLGSWSRCSIYCLNWKFSKPGNRREWGHLVGFWGLGLDRCLPIILRQTARPSRLRWSCCFQDCPFGNDNILHKHP